MLPRAWVFMGPTLRHDRHKGQIQSMLILLAVNESHRTFNFGFKLSQLGRHAWGWEPSTSKLWHGSEWTRYPTYSGKVLPACLPACLFVSLPLSLCFCLSSTSKLWHGSVPGIDEYAYHIPHPICKPKYTKVKVLST